jgi:hypothetical protein
LFITGFHSNHGEISPSPKLRDPPGLSNLTGPGPGLKKKSDYGLSDYTGRIPTPQATGV